MIGDYSGIEQEVETELAGVSDLLPVEAPEGALRRAGWAVREELHELWIEELSTPSSADEARQRMRMSLEHERSLELADDDLSETNRSANLAWRVFSGLGAAAMILLCLGVIRFGALLSSFSRPEPISALEVFVRAGDEVLSDGGPAAAVAEDLRQLERSVSDWTRDEMDDGLEQLGNDIENFFEEAEPLKIAS